MYCSEILQGNGTLEVEENDNSVYLKKPYRTLMGHFLSRFESTASNALFSECFKYFSEKFEV